MKKLGKIVPPYPSDHCASSACQKPWTDDMEAYLYCDLESDKLVIFCDDCARYAEMVAPERFKLVAL